MLYATLRYAKFLKVIFWIEWVPFTFESRWVSHIKIFIQDVLLAVYITKVKIILRRYNIAG